MIGCGGEYARDGSLKCRCTFNHLRTWSFPVAPSGILKSATSNVSLPLIFLTVTLLSPQTPTLIHLSLISGMKWLHGGTTLRSHRLPILQPDTGVVTSLAMDENWIVAGLSDTKIHVFSCRTGVLTRTLVGCQGGVWAVWLVEKGLWSSPSPRKKNTNSGSAGWGQETSLVVSGGCDKVLRVWDVETGYGDGRTSLRPLLTLSLL